MNEKELKVIIENIQAQQSIIIMYASFLNEKEMTADFAQWCEEKNRMYTLSLAKKEADKIFKDLKSEGNS